MYVHEGAYHCIELLMAIYSGDVEKITDVYQKIEGNPENFQLKDELVQELMKARQLMSKSREYFHSKHKIDLSSKEVDEV